MTKKLRLVLLATPIAASAAACSTQSGGTASAQTAGANSCNMDAKKICEATKDLTGLAHTGSTDDPSQIERNGPQTQSVSENFTTPGNTIISVQCDINVAHHRVIYAHVAPGAALTQSDIDYLHSQGFCTNSQ